MVNPEAPKPAAKGAAKDGDKKATRRVWKPRKKPNPKVKPSVAAAKAVSKKQNYEIAAGVYRYSPSAQIRRRALYKFVGKTTDKKAQPRNRVAVIRAIKGDKNGRTRLVMLKKRPKSYLVPKRLDLRGKKTTKPAMKVRKSLTPGTVCIVLAGRHRGRRVVLMKVLESGLLLINGPFKLNGVPLRRIHPKLVIATSTKIDISKVSISKRMNDNYFKRDKKEKKVKTKKDEGEIFAKTKERWTPSDKRKLDQGRVDRQVLDVIRAHPERRELSIYLKSKWGLRDKQAPHRMTF